MAYPIFMLAAETTTYGIGIMNKNQYSLICFVISVCINIGLAYLFIPILGLKGAALATFFSGIFLYVSRSVISQYLYSSILSLKVTIVDVIIIALMAVVPAFFSEVVSNISILFLLIIAMLINKEKIILLKTMYKL